MEIKVVQADISQFSCDAVIVNLFEGVKSPGGATGAVDQALDGWITKLIQSGEITGKLSETRVTHTHGKIPASRVIVAGLGKPDKFGLEEVRRAAAASLKAARALKAKKVATIVHGAGVGGLDAKAAAQALTEGALLGLYRFKKYKAEAEENGGEIDELNILERNGQKIAAIQEGVRIGKILSDATNLARDMINEPANAMTPTRMAEIAEEAAKANKLEFYVLDKDKMWELGMGALLGVAQGSVEPPRLIVLRYTGADPGKPALGLVGKGITFDSGGISIKPSERMEEMKGDMSGGAAVICAMKAIAQLKPKVNVTGVIPATENLPSGSAIKPGDIVRAMNGKTIEVINTDAEGRLILADGVAYARKIGCSPIVDVATLTGACAVAIGPFYSGVLGTDPALVDLLKRSAEAAGEKVWELPLTEEYQELVKSDVADIKNVGGRYGGAITGAIFIKTFAEDTPWVHVDIAPTFYGDKDEGYLPKGGRGVMVRTFVNLAQRLAEQ